MHELLVNRLGGLSLPRKSVVRLTDCPDMTIDVYRGGKTTRQKKPSSAYRTSSVSPWYAGFRLHLQNYSLDISETVL